MKDTLKVDWIKYEHFDQYKNPLLKAMLIKTNAELYEANVKAIEDVLDNWPGHAQGTLRIREARHNMEAAVDNIDLMARYLDDRNDREAFDFYRGKAVYDDVTAVAKKAALDENLERKYRHSAIGLLLMHDSLFAAHGDVARGNAALCVIARVMSQGIDIREGVAYLGEKIDWKDPSNRNALDNAKLREALLSETLPYLAQEKPHLHDAILTIMTDAFEKDFALRVRKAALTGLSTLCYDNESNAFLQNVADICTSSLEREPDAGLRHQTTQVRDDIKTGTIKTKITP